MSEIDSIVGRLLKKLADLGLEKDTLVIFTSDNGPWFEGSSGGLRERKGGGAYDGGYHVPFIARQPGFIPAGKTVDAMAMGIDLLPTFCSLAEASMPPGYQSDGEDITQVFRGSSLVRAQPQFWHYPTASPAWIPPTRHDGRFRIPRSLIRRAWPESSPICWPGDCTRHRCRWA